MKIKLISAVSIDGAIGKGQELLWHIKEDLQHYKVYTTNKTLVVGANTYEFLPLVAKKNRNYLVVDGSGELIYSQTDETNEHGLEYVKGFKSPEDAFKYAKDQLQCDEVIVVGGAMMYETTIHLVDECEITWVNKIYQDADKFFPIEKLSLFDCVSDSGYIKGESGISFKYCTYIK